MVQMFQPWLHLLEGAEGCQVGVYPRAGDSLPAATCLPSPCCRSLLSSLPLPFWKQNSLYERSVGLEGTLLPRVLLLSTHSSSSSQCQGCLAGFPSPLLPVPEHTKAPRAAQAWQKCPTFTEGSLALGSGHPHAVWEEVLSPVQEFGSAQG